MGKDLKGRELGKGISQRKDGRYEARVVVNGKRITFYNTNLSELKREFEREKKRLSRQNVTTCPDVTVMEWFHAWFDQYKRPTLKSTGVDAYYRKFNNTYGKLLGNVELKDLNQFAIQTATSELINQGYKTKSIKDALAVLKLMLDSAVANFMIEVNPCLGIIVPAYIEIKKERRVLSTKEQKKLLSITDHTFYKELYRFMLCTGVRVGELGALRWQDIDFQNELIYIRHSLHCQYKDGIKTMSLVTPKTKNSFRKIPFFKETNQLLLDQKEKQNILKQQLKERWRSDIEDLVFTTSMGSPITRYVLEHDMRQLTKEIQTEELYAAMNEGRDTIEFQPVHPHCLRHTFATRCFEKGMTPKTVQEIMGHANINMTMSYTHVLDEILKNEAKNIGAFLDDEDNDQEQFVS